MSTIRSLLRGSNRSPHHTSDTPAALSRLSQYRDRSGSASESDSEGYYEDHCGSSSNGSLPSTCALALDQDPDSGNSTTTLGPFPQGQWLPAGRPCAPSLPPERRGRCVPSRVSRTPPGAPALQCPEAS
eukprot:TRINITY_DN13501_c0_g1_i1.p4 TRINITY_DN13501_c0_g1~~TRINITY_DN13501_c0_g1_i1.p4  ORF type:complete len:136 (-),score=0.43 TRINITY_DN13501_c0_g1_i1:879-1265(-)